MSRVKTAYADDLATIGNNSGNMTPFEESEAEISELFMEATNWCDGEPVTTQAQADEVSKLLDQIRKAAKRADDRRADEAKPFDDGKKAVQEKYAPLISDTKSIKGKTVLAVDACKKALQPFLVVEEAKKQEAARIARAEADRRQAEAEEAFRAAQAGDLAARERAEMIARDAKRFDAAANTAEKDKAGARGGARAVTLRTTYEAEIVDMTAFARWCWAEQKPEMNEFFAGIAKRLVGYGKRDIPGIKVNEVKVPV